MCVTSREQCLKCLITFLFLFLPSSCEIYEHLDTSVTFSLKYTICRIPVKSRLYPRYNRPPQPFFLVVLHLIFSFKYFFANKSFFSSALTCQILFLVHISNSITCKLSLHKLIFFSQPFFFHCSHITELYYKNIGEFCCNTV